MRFETKTPVVPATVGSGTPVLVQDLVEKWLHLKNTNFNGTVKVMVSFDGTNFAELPTSGSQVFTGSASDVVIELPQTITHVRLDNNTDTSGTEPTAVLTGRNARTA